MMWVNLMLAAIVATYADMSSGLHCLECSEAKSDGDCEKHGQVAICNDNQNSCQTTIRYMEGNRMILNKRCKQLSACMNAMYRNGEDCLRPTPNSYCSCCCSTPLCNKVFNVTCATPGGPKKDKPSKQRSNQIKYQLKRKSIGFLLQMQEQKIKEYTSSREPSCAEMTDPIVKSRCSARNKAGSSCEMSCPFPYILRGASRISCQKNNMLAARWSHPQPCCTRNCPPFGDMDFVVAVDAHLALGAETWKQTRTFLTNLFEKFTMLLGNTRIGFFMFDQKVDSSATIPLKRHDRISTLRNNLNRIPPRKRVKADLSYSSALQFAFRRSFSPRQGDRANKRNVFLLITTTVSRNVPFANICAKWMRDSGVQLLGLSLNPSPVKNTLICNQLGNLIRNRNMILSSTMDVIVNQQDRLALLICGSQCERRNHL